MNIDEIKREGALAAMRDAVEQRWAQVHCGEDTSDCRNWLDEIDLLEQEYHKCGGTAPIRRDLKERNSAPPPRYESPRTALTLGSLAWKQLADMLAEYLGPDEPMTVAARNRTLDADALPEIQEVLEHAPKAAWQSLRHEMSTCSGPR